MLSWRWRRVCRRGVYAFAPLTIFARTGAGVPGELGGLVQPEAGD